MATRYNKASLVEDLTLHELFADAPKYKIAQFVDDFIEMITSKVIAGDEVALAGFGKFEKYQRENGSFKPKFTAFKDFKDAVK